MIRYTINETHYIQQQIFRLLNDLRNIHKQNGEYKNYLINIVRRYKKTMKTVLINIDKINTNKTINNMTSSIMYYLCGMDILKNTLYNKEKINSMKYNQRYRVICEKIWLDIEFNKLIG